MGEWMDVNGEAIHGTRRWIRDCQWGPGEKIKYEKNDHHFGNPIFEMTIKPRPGQAVKQTYFTSKGDIVYAITPGWPDKNQFRIRDIAISDNTQVSLLGSDAEIKWEKKGGDLIIYTGRIKVSDLPEIGEMYTFKITKVSS